MTPENSMNQDVRDAFAAQRRELEALRAQVAALQGRASQPARAMRRRRAWPTRVVSIAAVALLLALVPISLYAANPFTDLNPGSVHNGDIDLVFNAGITRGCTPTRYCPSDFVTREQMASFLARTAGLGDNAPVVNAARLGGKTLAEIESGQGGGGSLTVNRRVGTPIVIAFGAYATATASCQAGEKVVGGGFETPEDNDDVRLVFDRPNAAGTGWEVRILNNRSMSSLGLTAIALCATT